MLLGLGYLVGLVAALWCGRDLRRIPTRVWFSSGFDERAWYWGLGIWWVLGGWGALVLALVWRRSDARVALHEEMIDSRALRRLRPVSPDLVRSPDRSRRAMFRRQA